jgi:hypothetical protein
VNPHEADVTRFGCSVANGLGTVAGDGLALGRAVIQTLKYRPPAVSPSRSVAALIGANYGEVVDGGIILFVYTYGGYVPLRPAIADTHLGNALSSYDNTLVYNFEGIDGVPG